ncbi:hypothetical protein BJ986_001430 [Phycicoccus badiiscoriae]|uniref:Uncharacterized protein n=1 Tax=Pedococcus badiiscoriae TaxID=642776 RepID=A0A852WCS4_9MICO|nr:hypothetical protein [Pedococcus badiiscoriae]NYG06943.1 hypothetical protein [Pedococcus badiiscoriae]
MSTPPVPPVDKGDPEHDPTGIRELLSALPDPGPMPADLVARINASIAAEQLAREGGTVVPLRRRRWGWQQVGVAAAAAAILGFGLPALLTGTGPGDVIASLSGLGSAHSASSGAAARSEGMTASSASPGAPPASAADQRAGGALGPVVLGTSGTAYTAARLATQARTAVHGVLESGAAPKANGAAAAQSALGLRACLTALGVKAWMAVRGDIATLDGAPAVVAVVTSGTRRTVYAVSPACDATHPLVLAGPLAIP